MWKFLSGILLGLGVGTSYFLYALWNDEIAVVTINQYEASSEAGPITCNLFVAQMAGGEFIYIAGHSQTRFLVGGAAASVAYTKDGTTVTHLNHWGKREHKGSFYQDLEFTVGEACQRNAEIRGLISLTASR